MSFLDNTTPGSYDFCAVGKVSCILELILIKSPDYLFLAHALATSINPSKSNAHKKLQAKSSDRIRGVSNHGSLGSIKVTKAKSNTPC